MITIHMCFERTARIDLGDSDFCTKAVSFFCKPPATIPVAGYNYILTGNQGGCGDHDRSKSTLPGSMNIIKEAFHGCIVDCYDRKQKFSFCCHRPETVDTRRRFLTSSNDFFKQITASGMDVVD